MKTFISFEDRSSRSCVLSLLRYSQEIEQLNSCTEFISNKIELVIQDTLVLTVGYRWILVALIRKLSRILNILVSSHKHAFHRRRVFGFRLRRHVTKRYGVTSYTSKFHLGSNTAELPLVTKCGFPLDLSSLRWYQEHNEGIFSTSINRSWKRCVSFTPLMISSKRHICHFFCFSSQRMLMVALNAVNY